MGKVLLCTGKYAETPYHFEGVCVNVYCVEELCYLLASNPFMIDAEIMDKELAQWLDAECGLTELSHQLLTLFRRGSQPGTFVNTILDYVNYCTLEDRKKIDEVLQNNAGLSQYERQKKQGDFLIKNGRYQLAVQEYEKLLFIIILEWRTVSAFSLKALPDISERLMNYRETRSRESSI